MTRDKAKYTIYISRIVGILFLLVMAIDVAVSTTRLMFGAKIWGGDIFIACLVSFLCVFFLYKKKTSVMNIIIGCLVFFVILAVSIYGYGLLFGLDWDGNCYHKMAVGFLRAGWNPFRESADVFAPQYLGENYVYSNALWLDHYGKASWIFAADIYKLTCNIECGKVYQLFGILSVFFLSISYIFEKTKKYILSIIIAYIFAFNPVTIAQSVSYYVDGFLFSLIYILIIGLTGLLDEDADNLERWMIIFAAMSLVANVKFTGLLYGGLFCIVFFLLSMYKDYCNHNTTGEKFKWIHVSFKRCMIFASVAIVSVIWIGAPTYVKNTIDHGTPTYPLTGADVDIMTYNSPSGFEGKGALYQNFYGLFGRTEDVCYSYEEKTLPHLKIPFTFSDSELHVWVKEDIRIGGFGLLFSGIYLLSIILVLIILFKSNIDKKIKVYIASVFILCLGLHLFIAESWWARYSPYMYLIPIIVIITCYLSGNIKKIGKYMAYLLIVLLLVNNMHFYMRPYNIVKFSKSMRFEIEKIAGKEVNIALNTDFQGKYFNLEDRVVTYHLVDEVDDPDGVFYYEKWKER